MIYSTDNRQTWSRFQVLGWDKFLGFVGKSGLKAKHLMSYNPPPQHYDPPILDVIFLPMLFKRNSEASKRMSAEIDEHLRGMVEEAAREGPLSADVIRGRIREAAAGLEDGPLVLAALRGTLNLALELEKFRDLMKSGDVWVTWPYQRRSLRTSSRLTNDKAVKRLFDDWQIFTSSERWGIPGNSVSVEAALSTPKNRDVELTELQKSVLRRATHFAAMQAFADFAIIALHPGGTVPKVPAIGLAIATRSVMELAAHYLKGPEDPFESGERFNYSENLKNLELGDEYKEVLSFFKAETYWNKDPEVTDNAIHKTCRRVLGKVWNLLNTEERVRNYQDGGVVFEPYPEINVVTDWRTSIPACSLDSRVEVKSFGYEWLLALWIKDEELPKTKYEVNTRVFHWNLEVLIEGVQEYQHPKHLKFQRPLAAIADLLRTFCLAVNLNPLVCGAIARELHLHVEELTVRAGRSERYDNKKLEKLKKDLGISEEYLTQKAKEDDKSLKCIEDKLRGIQKNLLRDTGRQAPDLNKLRVRLQDVLQSFAHPGWLIRTETAKFPEPEDGKWKVRISNYYVSPFGFADIDPLTMVVLSYPYVKQRELNPFYAVFRQHIPVTVSEAMGDMSTLQSGTEPVPGSAFEIPFAAVEICRIAIEYFLEVGPKETSSPDGKPAS